MATKLAESRAEVAEKLAAVDRQIAELLQERDRLAAESEALLEGFRSAAQRYWGRLGVPPPAGWVWSSELGGGGSFESGDTGSPFD